MVAILPLTAGRRTLLRFGEPDDTGRRGVADIVLRQYQATTTVVLVTRSGTRFRLGVPVNGGAMRDPEFAAKVKQIWEYWQSATAAGPAGPHDSVESEEAASPDPSASAPPASTTHPQPGE